MYRDFQYGRIATVYGIVNRNGYFSEDLSIAQLGLMQSASLLYQIRTSGCLSTTRVRRCLSICLPVCYKNRDFRLYLALQSMNEYVS